MTYCVDQRALTSNLKVTVADRSDVALARQKVYQSNNAMRDVTHCPVLPEIEGIRAGPQEDGGP